MRSSVLALAAIVSLFVLGLRVEACDRCGISTCRSVTCRYVVTYVVEVDVEPCDEVFSATCIEWGSCGKVFYETRRLPCGTRVRTAKWILVDGSIRRKPTTIRGTSWITEDPDFEGKYALKTSSTSCGCGCYSVWVRTCVYRR